MRIGRSACGHSFQIHPTVTTTWRSPLLFLDLPLAERWLAAAAARFRPDDPSAGYRIPLMQAVAALFRGDLTRAVALAHDTVRAEPDVTSSHHFLAEISTYAGTADAAALVDAEVERAPEGRGVMAGITPRTLRAYLYLREGRPERARPLLETVLAVNRKAQEDGDRRSWFETAAAYALLGNREAAVGAWERVVERGFYNARVDEHQPLLAPIKDHPRFVAAMDRLRRDVAAMRARGTSVPSTSGSRAVHRSTLFADPGGVVRVRGIAVGDPVRPTYWEPDHRYGFGAGRMPLNVHADDRGRHSCEDRIATMQEIRGRRVVWEGICEAAVPSRQRGWTPA